MDLLDDVPQVSRVLQSQHPVLCSDFVKSGALFVTKERVRGPDGIPAIVPQTHLGLLWKLIRIKP